MHTQITYTRIYRYFTIYNFWLQTDAILGVPFPLAQFKPRPHPDPAPLLRSYCSTRSKLLYPSVAKGPTRLIHTFKLCAIVLSSSTFNTSPIALFWLKNFLVIDISLDLKEKNFSIFFSCGCFFQRKKYTSICIIPTVFS